MSYLKALKIRIASSIGILVVTLAVMFVYNKEISLSLFPLILLILLFIVYIAFSVWLDIKYSEFNSIWKTHLWQLLVNIAIVLSLIASPLFQDSIDTLFLPVLPILFTANYLIDDVRKYKLYIEHGLDENKDAYYLGKAHPEIIPHMSKKYRDYFSGTEEHEKGK